MRNSQDYVTPEAGDRLRLHTSRSIGRIACAAVATSVVLVMTQFVAADVQDPSADVLVVRRCLIEYEYNSVVGSTGYSLLQDCLVEPGARVKAGQILGHMQDEDLRAEVRLREAEASSDIEVKLGEAKKAQATAKMQRTANLIRNNAASREEFLQHRLEAEAAALEVEQAKHKKKLAGFQLDHAKAVLRTRELVSPHDGVIVAVTRRKGESLAPRDPVFQIVDTDHLRILCLVDVSEIERLKIGTSVRVIPEIAGVELPVEREVFQGKVVFIDTNIDPMSRTCKVHVRAQNRGGMLRAGLEARIEIDPDTLATPSVSPPEQRRR